MDAPIIYQSSSLRFFKENERHITRTLSKKNVLLLVFDGILRFRENGTDIEVHPGEYYIQKNGYLQQGILPSDAPKYFYVHFYASWSNTENILPFKGTFHYPTFKPFIEKLDNMAHGDASYIEKCAVFFEILSMLYNKPKERTAADEIAEFLEKHALEKPTLDDLSKEFHFSKNHIINLFKRDYKMTPMEYLNAVKIRQAKRLLITTSDSIETIALQCGFTNYSHFYKTFYIQNGISPSDWRNTTSHD